MAGENVFTDVDATLKALIEQVRLDGAPVPVRVVTPDPDVIEIETPCITLMLADVRRDGSRADNDRTVEKDVDAMTAEVRPASVPFNLHYTVTGHGATSREDRLLLEEVLLLLEENPILVSAESGVEFPLARDITFGEGSKERAFAKSVGIVVKARLQPRQVETVPLVREAIFHVKRFVAQPRP
jgi:hypothetical protein